MFAVLAVETEVPWVDAEIVTSFRGHTIHIRPRTETRRADIAVEYEGELNDAVSIGQAFLSQLAWQTKSAIIVDQHMGTSFPMSGISVRHTRHVSNEFRMDFKPKGQDQRSRLALALYREAQNTRRFHYGALAFYKIVKLMFPGDKKGTKQIGWLNSVANRIDDWRAGPRIKELQDTGVDIGKYVYVDIRCSIAHAYSQPTVNPDDSKDNLRLHEDMPILEAFARIAIEDEFQVQTQRTVWKEHKYELRGFRPLLDSRMIKNLGPNRRSVVKVPRLFYSIKFQGKLQPELLKRLQVISIEWIVDGYLVFQLRSTDGLVTTKFGLNIKDDRLEFSPYQRIECIDNGTAHAINNAIERAQMNIDWFCNGATEIYSEQQQLLGTSDPFIPTNINSHATIKSFEFEISNLKMVRARRLLSRG